MSLALSSNVPGHCRRSPCNTRRPLPNVPSAAAARHRPPADRTGQPALIDLPGGEAGRWEWYGNAERPDRRAHLLLVNAGQLFPVLSPHGTRTALRNAQPLVTSLITDALTDEALPANTFGALDTTKVRIAKTASPHLLGTMTDMTHAAAHLLDRARGPDALDDVNRQLRRWPAAQRQLRHPARPGPRADDPIR